MCSSDLTHSKQVIDFALFNYDNLIADYFEQHTPYLNQLLIMLEKEMQTKPQTLVHTLHHQSLTNAPNPVNFMMNLNKQLKPLGYYFIDD